MTTIMRVRCAPPIFACAAGLAGFLSIGAADALPAEDDTSQLQEIVVTAQKRPQNIQDVPISIVSLSADTLDKSGVISTGDIQHLASGLNIATVGSGFVSYTYIRGGGSNQVDPGSDPSVAYFLDEVYLGGSAGLAFDLVDIDHVEVLKGPQGTLFGRNAASGAISITSKAPSPTFGGTLEVEEGNYDLTHVKGSVTGSIMSDSRWLYRASFDFRRRDGFTENLVDDKHVDDVNTFGGRLALEYAGDELKFVLSADAMRARDGMSPQFLTTADKSGLFNAAAAATLPGGDSFYAHRYDVPGYENQNLGDVIGRLEWNTALGTLTSISALRTNTFNRLADYDGTSEDSFALLSHELDQTFSQELRVAGEKDQWHWIGGLYYYHAQITANYTEETGPAFPLAGVPFAALLGVPIPGAYPLNNAGTDDSIILENSDAAFGQLTYDFTERLSLSAGGRYSKDRKADERSVLGLVAAGLDAPAFTVDPHASWSSFDPSATLNYKVLPDVLTYVSYRQGFKSGGFQTIFPTTAPVANTPFAPEKVKSYEAGLKSEWFDRRFLADIAVFLSDIKNQQVLQALSVTNLVIDNAGATRDYGVDLTLNAKPWPSLTLGANMTLQHARFVTYLDGPLNYAGNAQLRSPDFSGNYSAEYAVELPGSSQLVLHGDYSYESKQFFDAANSTTIGSYQPGYGLANARLTYVPARSDWSVALWAKNLGNTHYYQNVLILAPTGLAVAGEPLTFGGSFKFSFN